MKTEVAVQNRKYEFGGFQFELAPVTIKRLREIQELQGDDLNNTIESIKKCLVGPVEEVDWEDVDIRLLFEVIADFLAQANPTAAADLRSSLGLVKAEQN